MILQNTLDLSTFEIIRFRIWNQTSNPDDYGIGTKYFNTNSGHDGYNRENIYTDTGWRKTAYLDDIDKITNGEGSLGTRVKALEDMLNVDSAETVVSTWEEIQAFLDNVKEGTDLMTMLDGKLDTKGGKMTGNLVMENSAIRFTTSGDGGYLSYSSSKGFFVANNAWDKEYPLLHSDNVGDYAVLADVYNENGVSPAMNTVGLLNGVGAYAKFGYGSYWFEFYSTASELHFINYRGSSSEIDKTIAFTDSVLLLDGSNTMAGNLKMTEGRAILWGSANLLQYTTSKFIIGRSASIDERPTEIHGYPIIFRYGNDEGTAMTITDKGNVLVGDTYGENVKFTVKGGASVGLGYYSISILPTKPSEINPQTTFSIISNYSNRYGLHTWIQSNGDVFLQSSYADQNRDECYALNLNPLGGAVNVGDGGLNVKGGIVMSGGSVLDKISATSTLNIVSEQGQIYISSKIETDFTTAKGNMFFNGETFTPWTQNNNAISLGRSEARWSNVYSVGGNFSGRVLIGGAVDDEMTSLQVGTDIRIGNTVSTSNRTHISAGTTAYYGRNGGYVLGNAFYDNDGDTILAYAGAYANNDTLLVYAIGLNIASTAPSNRWFSINSAESIFNVATTFNRGTLIPSGQKLTIGDANGDHATIEYDSIAKAIKVDGNLYTTGTLASGGKAKEGTGTGSGSANVRDFELPADEKTTYHCDHLLKSKNVIVQVFEKAIQNDIEVWEMILTDVTIVTEDRVTVTFGRPTTKVHKVHIIGGNVS